jgi:hypothetical protein
MKRSEAFDTMEQAIRDGHGATDATFRQQFTTYLFSHNRADWIKHQATLYGLETTVETGGGFMSRSHLITTRGPIKKLFVFWTTMLDWMEENG